MVLWLAAAATTAALAAAHSTPIPIDFSAVSRRFDGVGALSGGGGVTRLLVDYEDEDVQSDVLDALFKPMNGASLHWLKGGKIRRNSTGFQFIAMSAHTHRQSQCMASA